jgi:hypothetical protein
MTDRTGACALRYDELFEGSVRVKRCAFVPGVVLALLGGASPLFAQTAADLVGKIVAAQQTRGFTMRARLVTGAAGAEKPVVVQVRAIGRRDATARRVLYQALWPSSLKGQAVYIQRDQSEGLTGFLFEPPDTVTPLTSERLSKPLFDSELGLDDLAEEFWSWSNPAEVGEDIVEGQRCRVIELRAPASAGSSYGFVRACISPARMLPMRIEKYRHDGRLARRFVVKKAVRGQSGGWAPARILVETPDGKRTTMIEVSRGERDVTVSLAEFSIQKIKSLGKAQ